MSDLLRNWLQDDLGIETRVESFERELASGYLLGEIFYRCNLQPDFEKFVDRTHPDAMINNFTRLQPTVTKLGITFDSRMANKIMTEEKGVGTKFLYQVKTVLDSIHKDMHGSKLTGSFANTMSVPTTMSTAAMEAMKTRTVKATYDAKMHKQFEENMRLHTRNPNAIMETMHLKPFSDEMLRQHEQALYDDVTEYTMTMQRRENYRTERLNTMRMKRENAAEGDEEALMHHRASMLHTRMLEKKEVQIELAVTEKRARRQHARTAAAGQEAMEGIDNFEKTLKRLGCDEGGNEGGLEEGKLPPVGVTPLDHLVRIKSQLPPPSLMTKEGDKYMGRLHLKKIEDTAARKERERRRRKNLIDQARHAQEGEEKAREELLLQTLTQQSREEQRVAERLHQLKQEKEVMRENRDFRAEQYRTRREADYAEALAREAELAAAQKAQFAEAAEAENARWRAAQAKREAEARAEREAMMVEVGEELVSLALRCAEYRETTDALVPRKEYREWVSMFISGIPLDQALLDAKGVPPEPKETAMVLDAATVTDYLTCKGEWEVPEPIGHHEELGTIVDQLMRITIKEPVPADLPNLYYPVKLCMLGQPFSGKTTQALKVCEEHKLALLDPEKLVQAAVAEAEACDPKPPASGEEAPAEAPPPPPEPSEVALLGRRARDALQNEQPVPDDVLVALVVNAMVMLATTVDPPEEGAAPKAAGKGEKPPSAKAKPGSAKGGKDAGAAAPEPVRGEAVPAKLPEPRGFLLDGFPRTAAQAVLLEEAMTGLNLDRRADIKARASVLAPPPPDPLDALPLVSGFDKVVSLSLTDEAVALRRALGRRVDPQGGRIYHMEFDPPPEKDAGLQERLQENLGPYNDAAQAQERLTVAQTEGPALDEWVQKFENLHVPLSADGTPAENYVEVKAVADLVLDAKQKALETSLAARAAESAAAESAKAAAAAESARQSAQTAAESLLGVKKAEVDAIELLIEDEEDEYAQELVRAKASEDCAAGLLKATNAMREAQAAQAKADEWAASAAAALESARTNADGSAAAVEAKASAEFALAQAKVAASNATAAAATAKASADAAEAALAHAEKIAKMSKEELFPEEEPEPEKEPEPEPEPKVLTVPPFTVVPHTLAEVLYKQWTLLETSFLKGLKRAFYDLREERRVSLTHFAQVKRNFLAYMRRPDGKQALLTTFQRDYNAVDLDIRRLPEAKGEILLRSEELRDALWDVCDAKLEENEAELATIVGSTWVVDHSVLLTQQFCKLAQLEADCFVATGMLIADYYAVRCGYEPRGSAAKGVDVTLTDVEDWAEEVPDTAPEEEAGGKGGKGDPKADAKGKPAKGGKDDKAPVDMPEWMQPLQESAPTLVAALMAALALVTATAPGTPGSSRPSTAPEGKGSPPKGGADSKKDRDQIIAMASEAAVERHHAIFVARLQRLAARAAVYLAELKEAADMTKTALEEWLQERYTHECSAVTAAITIVRKAVAAETELPHDLLLDGEDLVEDADTLTLPPDVPPPPPPLLEPPPPLGVLTCVQLQLVARQFASAAPIGLMPLEEAAALLGRVGMEEGGQGLPTTWAHAPAGRYHDVLTAFDPHGTGFMDWREMMVSLIAPAFPNVPGANFLQLAEALKECKRVDTDGDGLITLEELLDAQCWFQLSYTGKGYNRFVELKKALFAALAAPNEATGDNRLNYELMIQYLATGDTLELGVAKVFHALNYAFGGNAEGAPLTAKLLEKAVYPLGRDLPLNVGRAEPATVTQSYRYSGTDLEELVELAAKAAGVEPDKDGVYAVSSAQLLAYPAGKELAEKAMQRYLLKMLTVA